MHFVTKATPVYRIVQNIDGGNFDGYWLFKYLTENILMDGHCLSPYTCKLCIVFKQFDWLNFDGLAGASKFPPIKTLRYMVYV